MDNNIERDLQTLRIEYESMSSAIDTLHSELRAVRDEMTAADDLRASARPPGGETWSEREQLLSDWEAQRWRAATEEDSYATWTRAALGMCATCEHAMITQGGAVLPLVRCLVAHLDLKQVVSACTHQAVLIRTDLLDD